MTIVRKITTAAELAEAHRVRQAVFTGEQGFDASLDIDDFDQHCTHWLLLPKELDTTPHGMTDALTSPAMSPDTSIAGHGLGTIRFGKTESYHTLGRLCVLKTARRAGNGQKLVRAVHDHARSVGIPQLMIHSQHDKVGFYLGLGYKVDDPVPFDEDGMPHIHMSIDLHS
ncbi:hypothetical protein BASA50_011065 [Batrachochytrium salamandrivorans]|uniref:N-acetyltransferase domain-containing protein n=1 Tax=Batrachochytrium salamandrivorans TaxID=1357716 RepID=A0ABQ8EWU9_9FUNG|nr:hypothetical protein BASA62_010402 [Batrachochytrium salamandrivorans]KAH6587873.1 hypothetical protein BASA50_011065 [Batrachochytrium salamandrivorans]